MLAKVCQIDLKVIYNPNTTMGFSATFMFQLYIILRSKHCRRPIAVMGVVDHLGQNLLCL